MHQQSKSEGRESLLLTSVGRIMIKANQQQTANVWIYFSPPAENPLPVANKAATGKYSCIFFKGKKLDNMDIFGLRIG